MYKKTKDGGRLLIANSTEELLKFAKKVGYPVLLVPFGLSEEEILPTDRKRRVDDEDHLLKIADEVLAQGLFRLVHVLKISTKQCY